MGHIPRGETAGGLVGWSFNRCCQTIFRSSCVHLSSCQQCMRVPCIHHSLFIVVPPYWFIGALYIFWICICINSSYVLPHSLACLFILLTLSLDGQSLHLWSFINLLFLFPSLFLLILSDFLEIYQLVFSKSQLLVLVICTACLCLCLWLCYHCSLSSSFFASNSLLFF